MAPSRANQYTPTWVIIFIMIVSPELLRSNVDYNPWANLRLLDVAAKLAPKDLTHDFQTADRSILQTLVHIFGADRVWLARLTGEPSDVFPDGCRSQPGSSAKQLAATDGAMEALRQGSHR